MPTRTLRDVCCFLNFLSTPCAHAVLGAHEVACKAIPPEASKPGQYAPLESPAAARPATLQRESPPPAKLASANRWPSLDKTASRHTSPTPSRVPARPPRQQAPSQTHPSSPAAQFPRPVPQPQCESQSRVSAAPRNNASRHTIQFPQVSAPQPQRKAPVSPAIARELFATD